MIPLLVSFVAFVISFALAAKLLDGMKVNGGVGAHIVAAVLFGVLSTVCAGILVFLLGLLTFGVGWLLAPITYLFANAMLLILASKLTSRLTVDGLWTAFKASFLMAIFGWLGKLVAGVLFLSAAS